MARCASVDPLGFHNISVGLDSIKCSYDDSKADKDGEKLSEKNIYANPLVYRQCFWTSFAVYCCIHSESLCLYEKLFLKSGSKEGSAGGRYQEQLLGLLKSKRQIVMNHIRLEHANAYGLRKGSATHATSGTTCPPPMPSIARRGEWSMGTVLDVYWHFSEPGDHYLGRILSGMDPSKANFGTLPPHFSVVDPLSDPDIKKAAEMVFGGLLNAYTGLPNDPKPILIRSLACLVFHSEELISVMNSSPGHDFTKITILHDGELLNSLRNKVTLDKTEGVMCHATGIPPHVELAIRSKVRVA